MKKILNTFTRLHFIYVIVAFIAAGFMIIIQFEDMFTYEKLAYALFLGLCFHQIEEYFFPGGFIYGFNTLQGSNEPHRFPGNRVSAVIVDFIALFAGLVALIFKPTPSVAAFFAIFGLMEFFMHTVFGIVIYFRMKEKGKETIYFPGLGSAFMIFAPCGIAELYELLSNQLLNGTEWTICIISVLAFAGIFVMGCQKVFENKESTYGYCVGHYEGYFSKYLKSE